jgi:hypothetical protein
MTLDKINNSIFSNFYRKDRPPVDCVRWPRLAPEIAKMAKAPAAAASMSPQGRVEGQMDALLTAARQAPTQHITIDASPEPDPKVRSDYLRWFLLEGIPSVGRPISLFEMRGATVVGPLHLRGTELKILTRFVKCNFHGIVDLCDAKIVGLDIIAGCLEGVLGDRLTALGSLIIRSDVAETCDPFAAAASEATIRINTQIRLCGAKIRGNLDLRGCAIRGMDDAQSNTIALFADGMTVEGNLLLSNWSIVTGEVRLNGSEIKRNVDCSSASLLHWKGFSLSAAGARIAGTIYACKITSQGIFRLSGASVGGDCDCTDSLFVARPFLDLLWQPNNQPIDDGNLDSDLDAIAGIGLSVNGDLILGKDFHARGCVNLVNARIGGDLSAAGGFFDFPGEEPLCADGISVTGSTFFDQCRTNGTLRFVQANLKQGFFADGATFDVTPDCRGWTRGKNAASIELGGTSCGIYAKSAEVGGKVRWRGIQKHSDRAESKNPLWLYLVGAKASRVEDDRESWSRVDRFDVSDCQYATLATPDGDIGWDWRLEQLDRQYAVLNGDWLSNIFLGIKLAGRAFFRWASDHRADRFDVAAERFKPQPYLQLAKAVRDAGYDKAANDIMVHLERNRTLYGDYGFLRQLWRWLLHATIRYGYSPLRPVFILVAWILISALIFEKAYFDRTIVPVKPNQDIASYEPNKGYVSFNPLIFAIDTLVPIVDFGQKKNWVVEPLSDESQADRRAGPPEDWRKALGRAVNQFPPWGVGRLIVFNALFGWLMTTLFAAGVTGLLRAAK